MTILLIIGVELFGILLISLAVLLLVLAARMLLLPRSVFRVLAAIMGLYASLSIFAFGLFIILLPAMGVGAN